MKSIGCVIPCFKGNYRTLKIIKRCIEDVVATVEFRNLKGELVNTFKMNMDEPRAYSICASEYVTGAFIGSIYVFFNSSENLAVPFCAVVCSIKTQNSVCGNSSCSCLLPTCLGLGLGVRVTAQRVRVRG